MSDPCFGLSDTQLAQLKPPLPNMSRGVPRVDDRRVINSVVLVLKSCGCWADAPTVYGPR